MLSSQIQTTLCMCVCIFCYKKVDEIWWRVPVLLKFYCAYLWIGNLIKMQVLFQQMCNEAHVSAFLKTLRWCQLQDQTLVRSYRPPIALDACTAPTFPEYNVFCSFLCQLTLCEHCLSSILNSWQVKYTKLNAKST